MVTNSGEQNDEWELPTEEKIREIAKRYGIEVMKGKREPGLYIGDRKLEFKDLFPELQLIEEDEQDNK